jgi:hypothetical protein
MSLWSLDNGKSISSEGPRPRNEYEYWYYVKKSFIFLITLISKPINKIVSKKKDH